MKNNAAVHVQQDSRFTQSGKIASKTAACLLVVAVFATVSALLPGCQKDEYLKVSFLDVGQGDSVLVSKGNTQVLIDGGPSPAKLLQELAGKMPFFDRNIEMVILTHPHTDHINGLLEVLRRYNVSRVVYPASGDGLVGYEVSAYSQWLKLIEKQQIPAVTAHEGMSFHMGEAVFNVINPGKVRHKGTVSDIDNNSIVLEMCAGDFSFLVTGDIMWQGELDLVMGRKISPVNVLKVAHHGSKTSSSFEFLSVVRPDIGVICVGDNKFGHPDEITVNRISYFTGDDGLFRTDELGGITFLTDGRSLWMELDQPVETG